MNISSTFAASDGEEYELQMGRWSRRLAEPFLDFTGSADGEDVLDVGCGTGNLAFAINNRTVAKTIKGIDFSGTYIENAKAKNKIDKISFEVGDAAAMPFADSSFDRVLSMLVLFFIPDAKRAVSEMYRVARPGATVAATLWDFRGGLIHSRLFWDTAAMMDERANKLRASGFARPLARPAELVQAWHDAGFADVEETALTISMDFANFADYWRPYLGKQGPGAQYITMLNADELAKLEGFVRRAYLDGDADGPRSHFAVARAVKGRKS
jgi:ubiquinone/menaquinone biosynthesis C-methylase UbiE